MLSVLTQFELDTFIDIKTHDFMYQFTNIGLVFLLIILIIKKYIKKEVEKDSWVDNIKYITIKKIRNIIINNLERKVQPLLNANLTYIFILVFITNVISLVPYTYTITSSLIITLTLTLINFINLNIIGCYVQGWSILNILSPKGLPWIIAPVMLIIEIISYLARIASLSIRLFTNLMSGHALLKILTCAMFQLCVLTGSIMTTTIISTITIILSIHVIIAIFILEIIVCILQTYVYIILNIIYTNDVVYLGH